MPNAKFNIQLKSSKNYYFNGKEMSIFKAYNGYMGIEYAKNIKPDLIILDIGLPDISGLEVHKQLINHQSTLHTKFVILSGKLKFEPDDAVFIRKPVGIEKFVEAVKIQLHLKKVSPA